MDFFVVVAAFLLLFLWGPRAQWRAQVAVGVLGADHESDLTGRVSWDGGIGVVDGGKDFFARFLEIGDKLEV